MLIWNNLNEIAVIYLIIRKKIKIYYIKLNPKKLIYIIFKILIKLFLIRNIRN
jgi:hypothetical protein